MMNNDGNPFAGCAPNAAAEPEGLGSDFDLAGAAVEFDSTATHVGTL